MGEGWPLGTDGGKGVKNGHWAEGRGWVKNWAMKRGRWSGEGWKEKREKEMDGPKDELQGGVGAQ